MIVVINPSNILKKWRVDKITIVRICLRGVTAGDIEHVLPV